VIDESAQRNIEKVGGSRQPGAGGRWSEVERQQAGQIALVFRIAALTDRPRGLARRAGRPPSDSATRAVRNQRRVGQLGCANATLASAQRGIAKPVQAGERTLCRDRLGRSAGGPAERFGHGRSGPGGRDPLDWGNPAIGEVPPTRLRGENSARCDSVEMSASRFTPENRSGHGPSLLSAHFGQLRGASRHRSRQSRPSASAVPATRRTCRPPSNCRDRKDVRSRRRPAQPN